MKQIVITVENEEHKETILDVLTDAEGDGVLDFAYQVQVDSVPTSDELYPITDHVIIEDPEITGRQTATIETLDENGEWGNKVTLNEEQYKHELKSQADDENRHLGDGSIFSG